MLGLRRGFSRIAALAVVVAFAGPVVPARASGMVVLPGYDLFRTLPGTRIGLSLPGAPDTMVHFTTAPLGEFAFGGDSVATGGADTIVRRLDTATPENGRVRIELLALQMRSYDPAGWFVTLQSDRGRNALDPPDGPPSVGLLDIAFDPDGLGGTYTSKLLVNYDVRAGALDGQIVASGSAPIVDGDVWHHARPTEPVGGCHDEARVIGHCIGVDTDTLQVCSTTTGAPIAAMPGIDTNLNGTDESADFHPFSAPATANDHTLCVGGLPGSGPGEGGVRTFTGTAHIGCFGCGTYGPVGNSFSGTVAGVADSPALVSGGVTATFTVNEDPTTCPVVGSAVGTTAGALRVSFTWSRVGAVAVITTTGDVSGAGTATFTVTSPVGNPCGSPVDALVTGTIAGT